MSVSHQNQHYQQRQQQLQSQQQHPQQQSDSSLDTIQLKRRVAILEKENQVLNSKLIEQESSKKTLREIKQSLSRQLEQQQRELASVETALKSIINKANQKDERNNHKKDNSHLNPLKEQQNESFPESNCDIDENNDNIKLNDVIQDIEKLFTVQDKEISQLKQLNSQHQRVNVEDKKNKNHGDSASNHKNGIHSKDSDEQSDAKLIRNRQLSAILNGFLGDLEQVRVSHSIPDSYFAGTFLNLYSAITPEGLSQPEAINDIVLALLSQIELSISRLVESEKKQTRLIVQLNEQTLEVAALRDAFAENVTELDEIRSNENRYKDEITQLQADLKAQHEQYQLQNTIVIQQHSADKFETQYQLKAENEKLYKENSFLNEMMLKLASLMPSDDCQQLLCQVIDIAQSVLQSEKERVYLEQLLEVNEQNLKMAIRSLVVSSSSDYQSDDLSDSDVCSLRKSVEQLRLSLQNCAKQKSMNTQALGELLEQLDRATLMQHHRLSAILSTEKEELVNQAYSELLAKEQQLAKFVQIEGSQVNRSNSNADKNKGDSYEYVSVRQIMQQRKTAEGRNGNQTNPLLVLTQQLQQQTINIQNILNQKQSHNDAELMANDPTGDNLPYYSEIKHPSSSFSLKNSRGSLSQSGNKLPQQIQQDSSQGGLLQKHMLLRHHNYPFQSLLKNKNSPGATATNSNPLLQYAEKEPSQDEYFSRLDYSKSSDSDTKNNYLQQHGQQEQHEHLDDDELGD